MGWNHLRKRSKEGLDDLNASNVSFNKAKRKKIRLCQFLSLMGIENFSPLKIIVKVARSGLKTTSLEINKITLKI